MKKYIFLISIALGLSIPALSQDTLYFKNGEKLRVIIVEEDQAHVRYHYIGTNKKKKTRSTRISELDKIVYSSGFVKVISEQEQISNLPRFELDPISHDFGRHLIAINLLDAALGAITISYEHTVASGEYSLRVPISIGTNRGNDKGYHLDDSKVFSMGIDVSMYPSGQGRQKFFFGPSFEFGTLDHDDEMYAYSYSYKNDGYNAFLMNIGVLFQPSRHVNVSIRGGFGYVDKQEFEGAVAFRGGLLAGYKF